MAKLADAPDLGSGAARRGGSSPLSRTTLFKLFLYFIMRIVKWTPLLYLVLLFLMFVEKESKEFLPELQKAHRDSSSSMRV